MAPDPTPPPPKIPHTAEMVGSLTMANPDARNSDSSLKSHCNRCHACGGPLDWRKCEDLDGNTSYRPWSAADCQEYRLRPTSMPPHPDRHDLRFSDLGNGVDLYNNEAARVIAELQSGYRFSMSQMDQFKQTILSAALMVNFHSLIPNFVDSTFPPQPEVSVPFPLRGGQPIPPCFIPSNLNPKSPVFRPASTTLEGQPMQEEASGTKAEPFDGEAGLDNEKGEKEEPDWLKLFDETDLDLTVEYAEEVKEEEEGKGEEEETDSLNWVDGMELDCSLEGKGEEECDWLICMEGMELKFTAEVEKEKPKVSSEFLKGLLESINQEGKGKTAG